VGGTGGYIDEEGHLQYDAKQLATKEYVDSLFAAVADIKNYLGIE
jgi:hypothetical protein